MQNRIHDYLKSNENKLNLLNEYKSDYIKLSTTLRDVVKKTSHNMMVPIGKKAMMHGTLVHTNEVLVLLGDNYFTEQSVYQSRQIIQRRLTHLNEQIKNLSLEIEKYKAMGFNTDNASQIVSQTNDNDTDKKKDDDEFFEIREPYVSDDENENHNTPLIEEVSGTNSNSNSLDDGFKDFLDQLEALEVLEEKKKKLNNDQQKKEKETKSESESKNIEEKKEKKKKNLVDQVFSDIIEHNNNDRSSSSQNNNNNNNNNNNKKKISKFRASRLQKQ